MRVIERNLQEIGSSLLVTMPKEWTKAMNLKKGSKIKMMLSEQGNIVIAPEFVRKEKGKEIVLPYDEHYARRFFREYFDGKEKITFLAKSRIDEKERKALHKFFDRFMNVQVIEETDKKMVVKCFRIEELSIKECLKRMYFLSLNMIDEAASTSLEEMENSLTKFYYMLVMQVRRFLSEGKFADQNQIPLIRALDCRMVAEKIERIADTVKKRGINGGFLKQYKKFYSRSFNYFINSDYEGAFPLRAEYLKQSRKTKNPGELLLLEYAKEISMLVR